jgi:hypothetical protein
MDKTQIHQACFWGLITVIALASLILIPSLGVSSSIDPQGAFVVVPSSTDPEDFLTKVKSFF